MFINLYKLPKWVLEQSDFLKTLYEECDSSNELSYIPFLNEYDESYDFSELFQKEKPYLDVELAILIYKDTLQLLDFFGFERPFYQWIEPKKYEWVHDSVDERILRHLRTQIHGVQLFAFDFESLPKMEDMHKMRGFSVVEPLYEFEPFRKTVQLNQLDWLEWFISHYDGKGQYGMNQLVEYIDYLYPTDLSTVSLETFEWLQDRFKIRPFELPALSENIIKSRNLHIFQKYRDEIAKVYQMDLLLLQAIQKNHNESNESHLNFFQKLIVNHTFNNDYYLVRISISSENPLLVTYMFRTFHEKMTLVITPIYDKIAKLALSSAPETYFEKCALFDMFQELYPHVIGNEVFIKSTFIRHEIYDHQDPNDTYYDIAFIRYVIERSGHAFTRNAYQVALILHLQDLIDSYHQNAWSETEGSYDVRPFINQFRIVIKTGNLQNIRFYIDNHLYIHDDERSNDYLMYAIHDIRLFKLIYEYGRFRNIGDTHLWEAFQRGKCDIVAYMIQRPYQPSSEMKKQILEQWNVIDRHKMMAWKDKENRSNIVKMLFE